MRPIILIPARMQATRLPGKPLADIAGQPMVVQVLNRAREAGVAPVYVACDDERIRLAVQAAGGQAIMTRPDHPSGSDRIFEALQTLDPAKEYDIVINLQGDVPTLDPNLIRAVLEPLKNPAVDIATLACEITDEREKRDPSVVKPLLAPWREGNITGALMFCRELPGKDEGGPVYHHIGIYAYRRAALERFVALPPSPLEIQHKLEQLRALEAGMRIDIALVDTVPLGVDTPEHLERARAWMERKS